VNEGRDGLASGLRSKAMTTTLRMILEGDLLICVRGTMWFPDWLLTLSLGCSSW
jgi:hypothetical protein